VQRRLRLLNLSFQLVATGVVPTEQDRYAADFARLETSVEDPAQWHRYYIIFLSEQAPSRDSRVTLGAEEDFFGLPRPDLCWRVGQQDYDTVRTALDLLRTEVFDRPEFRMERRIAAKLEDWVIGYGAHHIGTARMSRSAQDGVVDRDCRIHGLANGFCAGSAVFATAGMANPVLASIALAMRLGDHLVARLPSLPPAETAGQMRRPAIYALA
jgi:choline dehydrogenase-like flavoprotein